ncbi:PRC-barrel domain containing protein [Streptomyces sp. NPDC001922]|uniref:PRC-barrel domain containing protein n=1 Tax=unclassified Streptomyces TaxID=2593676 RepID=UPI003331702A
MTENIWAYTPTAGYLTGTDLAGYTVEATDGSVGKVDKHFDEAGSAFVIVDTGIWIFGKHVLLPAGTISSVDHELRTLFVARTKDEIKNAPEFDRDQHSTDPEYHRQVGGYYGGFPA